MNICVKKNTLFLETGERLDFNNAEAEKADMDRAMEQYPDLPVCVDAGNLKYLSSHGLRILMLLAQSGRQASVINVSPDVYEIFEMTGFTTLMDIRKRMRTIDLNDCTLLGEGAFGSVYRLDQDTVVKVFRGGEDMLAMMESEKEKARKAFLSGIPTAIPFDIVQVGEGSYGIVFEMIDAQNCNDIVRDNPAALDWMIPQYAAFINSIHQLQTSPGQLKDNRELYLSLLDEFLFLDKETTERLRGLLQDMPEELGLIHGDIQLKNVMLSDGKMILVDMDRLSCGNPVFEFAGVYAAYIAFNEDKPDDTECFLGISGENAGRIFRETLERYFELRGETLSEEEIRKVQTVGYLRFLEILVVEKKNIRNELKDRRIRHTARKLEELAFAVDSLAL